MCKVMIIVMIIILILLSNQVNEGAEVAVVEAMKMQNVLRASHSGKVKSINVKPDSSVAAEEILIEFED